MKIERLGDHGEFAGRRAGPLGLGAVEVEFDTVLVRVAEVERFTDAVIGSAVEIDAGREKAAEGIGQFAARGIENREMKQAGVAGRRRRAAQTLPVVQADVMMISAGGEERGLSAEALRDGKAKDAVVEGNRAIEVGHFEVNVADAGGRMDGARRAHTAVVTFWCTECIRFLGERS